jgi:hypothetical protein
VRILLLCRRSFAPSAVHLASASEKSIHLSSQKALLALSAMCGRRERDARATSNDASHSKVRQSPNETSSSFEIHVSSFLFRPVLSNGS